MVCPYDADAGGRTVWVDTWTFSLDDARAIRDTFLSGRYWLNAISATTEQICAALRASGVDELERLSEDVEAL